MWHRPHAAYPAIGRASGASGPRIAACRARAMRQTACPACLPACPTLRSACPTLRCHLWNPRAATSPLSTRQDISHSGPLDVGFPLIKAPNWEISLHRRIAGRAESKMRRRPMIILTVAHCPARPISVPSRCRQLRPASQAFPSHRDLFIGRRVQIKILRCNDP
jgi:hypothetical protein